MEKADRTQMITELKERLEYFNDERLRLLYKSTKPVTEEDIQADIIKHSERIPPDHSRRF